MKKFEYILRHKIQFFKTRNSNEYLKKNISLLTCLLHDLDKLITCLFLKSELSSTIHRKIAGHHRRKTKKHLIEAWCDWECARFTKPDKQMNAFETWKKYYPNLDMDNIYFNFMNNEEIYAE